MKKILLIVTAMTVMAMGLTAEDTTWTNPLSSGTADAPHSMLNTVSNGTMYDAIDVLIASPSELSNYPGYTFYTAYGNYMSWSDLYKTGFYGPYVEPTTSGVVNPFTSTGITDFFDGNGSIAFGLGYLMPLFDFQTGIVGGFSLGKVNGLTGFGGFTDSDGNALPSPAGNVTYSESNTVDGAAGVVGQAAYTNTEAFDYTSREVRNNIRVGAGADLGFMGVSALFNSNYDTEYLGGTYNYTWTAGADTAEYDPTGTSTTTSKSVVYGYNSEGNVVSDIVKDNNWDLQLTGQLPISLGKFSMPLTTALRLGRDSDGVSAYGIPMTSTVTDAYVATNGAGGTVSDTSTMAYTIGIDSMDINAVGVDPDDEHLGVAGPAAGEAATAYTTALGYFAAIPYANRIEGINDGAFSYGLSARMDPQMSLNDILTLKTRASVDFDMNIQNNSAQGYAHMLYSRADSGASNSTHEVTANVEDPSTTIDTDLTFELGGILEAKSPNGRLTISSGFFYNPVLNLSSETNDNVTSTFVASLTDQTAATPEAVQDVTVNWDDLAFGTAQGTVNQTTTTTYSGPDVTNVVTHNFLVPVSAKIDVVENKLSLIGGYLLNGSFNSTYTEEAVITDTTTTTSVTTSTGTNVSPTAATASVADNQASITSREMTQTTWAGQVSWMLRWMPGETVTVDFFGQSIMSALNFDLFGDDGVGNDFNISDVIDSLAMSVTFSF